MLGPAAGTECVSAHLLVRSLKAASTATAQGYRHNPASSESDPDEVQYRRHSRSSPRPQTDSSPGLSQRAGCRLPDVEKDNAVQDFAPDRANLRLTIPWLTRSG